MRRAVIILGIMLMGATAVEGDDKRPERVEEKVTPGLIHVKQGGEVVAIKHGDKEYSEKVQVQVMAKGSSGKLLNPTEVWACREVTKEKIVFSLYGRTGREEKKQQIPFPGEDVIGVGTIIIDSSGDEFTVTETAGRQHLVAKLTKKAAEVKKEGKK